MDFEYTQAVAILRRTPATLAALLRGLPDAWISSAEGPETWSVYDIVGHLLHGDEANWLQRAHLIIEQGERRPFDAFNRTAMFEKYQGASLDDLLTAFAQERAKNLAALDALHLTPEQLALTVDAPEPTPDEVSEYLGVDLGIIQLATTSDGEFLNSSAGPKHAHVNEVRARYSRFRQKLQKKGTKSAKRLLKQRSGREQRFAKDVNHCLSKAIVSTAKGTGRGVALEDLTHLRSRVNGSKRQRRVLHTWSFFQLRAFIAYKAALAGVRVVYVNPAYTSQTCSACGHCEQANRLSQAKFLCTSCGFSAHADVNAAVNIGRRAAVNRPDAAALAG